MAFIWVHLGVSLEDMKKPINKTRLKIAVLKWHPGLPGANELRRQGITMDGIDSISQNIPSSASEELTNAVKMWNIEIL